MLVCIYTYVLYVCCVYMYVSACICAVCVLCVQVCVCMFNLCCVCTVCVFLLYICMYLYVNVHAYAISSVCMYVYLLYVCCVYVYVCACLICAVFVLCVYFCCVFACIYMCISMHVLSVLCECIHSFCINSVQYLIIVHLFRYNTSLHVAVQNKHAATIQYLVNHQRKLLHMNNKIGNSPMHEACKEGNEATIILLLKTLDEGLFLATNKNGQTPLDLLLASKHPRFVL